MSILEQIIAGQAPGIVPLTVEQYHQMIASGILREGDSMELIDGILIRKDRADKGGDPMSHGPRHALGIKLLQRPLRKVEQHGYHLQSQLPVTLGAVQEPEPDLAVVRGPEEDYARRHPGPLDLAAVMEVADSSLTMDRTSKQRLYAIAGIPIYWIINLVDNQIEVYENPLPAEAKYARHRDYAAGQSVILPVDTGLQVEVFVAAVLPA